VLTRDDLIDLIVRHLQQAGAVRAPESAEKSAYKEKSSPKGRLFLSEYDIKKRLTSGGRRLTIPKDAIVSPQAADWLVLQGVEIVRE
jgi:hypothetical protein